MRPSRRRLARHQPPAHSPPVASPPGGASAILGQPHRRHRARHQPPRRRICHPRAAAPSTPRPSSAAHTFPTGPFPSRRRLRRPGQPLRRQRACHRSPTHSPPASSPPDGASATPGSRTVDTALVISRPRIPHRLLPLPAEPPPPRAATPSTPRPSSGTRTFLSGYFPSRRCHRPPGSRTVDTAPVIGRPHNPHRPVPSRRRLRRPGQQHGRHRARQRTPPTYSNR